MTQHLSIIVEYSFPFRPYKEHAFVILVKYRVVSACQVQLPVLLSYHQLEGRYGFVEKTHRIGALEYS